MAGRLCGQVAPYIAQRDQGVAEKPKGLADYVEGALVFIALLCLSHKGQTQEMGLYLTKIPWVPEKVQS